MFPSLLCIWNSEEGVCWCPLACEDGWQVEAHEVILASFSPFFLNLFGRRNIPIPWSTWEAWSQKILWSWMTSSSLEKQLFNRETWIPSLLWLMSCNWKFSWDQMLRKMLKKILYWKKTCAKSKLYPPLKKKKKTSSEIILLLKLKSLLPWNELLLFITTLWLQTSKIWMMISRYWQNLVKMLLVVV